MLADEGVHRLGEPDEADRQRAVLEDLAHPVLAAEPLRVDPHPLPHEEREVAHPLAGLDREALHELADDELDALVERAQEAVDVAVGLDRQARQVDRREGEVPPSVGDGPVGVVDIGHDPRAAAHVRDLGLGAAGDVMNPVEGGVLEREVREEAPGSDPAGQLQQVVVGVAGVEVDALLDAEDLDGEDRGLAVAQPRLGRQEQLPHDHPRLRRDVRAVIDRGERRLRPGARVHRVEVGDEGLHRLVGESFGLAHGALADPGVQGLQVGALAEQAAQIGALVAQLGRGGLEDDVRRVDRDGFDAQEPGGRVRILQEPALEGPADPGGHVDVEVGDRLPAVLVVLVRLDRDAGERRVGTDRLRFAQVAVTGREAPAEQIGEADLAAGRRERVEVEVVDVDVPEPVGGRVLGGDDLGEVEVLGALGAVAEHGAHRGLAVDVGVLPQGVVGRGVRGGDAAQGLHEGRAALGGAGRAACDRATGMHGCRHRRGPSSWPVPRGGREDPPPGRPRGGVECRAAARCWQVFGLEGASPRGLPGRRFPGRGPVLMPMSFLLTAAGQSRIRTGFPFHSPPQHLVSRRVDQHHGMYQGRSRGERDTPRASPSHCRTRPRRASGESSGIRSPGARRTSAPGPPPRPRPQGTIIGVPVTGSSTTSTATPKTSSTIRAVTTSAGVPWATTAPPLVAA